MLMAPRQKLARADTLTRLLGLVHYEVKKHSFCLLRVTGCNHHLCGEQSDESLPVPLKDILKIIGRLSASRKTALHCRILA